MSSVPDHEAVVRAFVEAINAHDPDALAELMTHDHRFVDSTGAVIGGRDTVRDAWRQYYEVFPDYVVDVEELLSREGTVALFGIARGMYARAGGSRDDDALRIPAAWRARVRDGKIAEWSVFADNDAVRRVMGS